MQLASPSVAAAGTPTVLASQTIDASVTSNPAGHTTMWSTDREFRLAGAHDGLDTYTSVYDAIRAASALSAGEMPGLAVVHFRGGFRVHDVHTASRTYWSNSPHGPMAPITKLTSKSSVPFAAGNVRPSDAPGNRHSPAVVRDDSLVALIDGDRAFVPSTDASWAGRPRLVERKVDEYEA
ncbi:MAG: hypothetical protein JWL76_1488 [Thermoleophilia bacterium]|nr:hypothetical protein [Thermoleophilia bacterium]